MSSTYLVIDHRGYLLIVEKVLVTHRLVTEAERPTLIHLRKLYGEDLGGRWIVPGYLHCRRPVEITNTINDFKKTIQAQVFKPTARPGRLCPLQLPLVILATFLLSSCAHYAPETVQHTGDVPSFFSGMWHGFIAPISFIGSWFNHSIAVFATPNSGGWYEFGFLFGLAGCGTGTW